MILTQISKACLIFKYIYIRFQKRKCRRLAAKLPGIQFRSLFYGMISVLVGLKLVIIYDEFYLSSSP